ncbi:hypothetical protein MMC25_001000 [Agyrium rufum]|nr:hypothetical protein [Agyrium rufum]
MSRSSDPENFFQTNDSIATIERKRLKSTNNNGSPIRLKSKLLALQSDPSSPDHVYVAQASGSICRASVKTGGKHSYFTGPEAPLTSIALSFDASTIYAGCWDKSIWSWSTRDRTKKTRLLRGHSDFVKCVLCVSIGGKEVLISGGGGSDAKIVFWDPMTGRKLQTIATHTTSIQALAVARYADLIEEAGTGQESVAHDAWVLLSASTTIQLHVLEMTSSSTNSESSLSATPAPIPELSPHATTITSLLLESSQPSAIHSTSLDHAYCSTPLPLQKNTLQPDTTLSGDDYVRCQAISRDGAFVFTGGRDEDVWVWSSSSGELVGKWVGHYDEIMGMCLSSNERKVVTAGIDGTIRTWPIGEGLEGWGKGWIHAGDGNDNDVGEIADEDSKIAEKDAVGGDSQGIQANSANIRMTEDEERELAELMEEDS